MLGRTSGRSDFSVNQFFQIMLKIIQVGKQIQSKVQQRGEITVEVWIEQTDLSGQGPHFLALGRHVTHMTCRQRKNKSFFLLQRTLQVYLT